MPAHEGNAERTEIGAPKTSAFLLGKGISACDTEI
jgi:hypothetical protein